MSTDSDAAAPPRTLSPEEISGVADFKLEHVDVPEWGGRIWIRTLTADQRDDFVVKFLDQGTGKIRPGIRSVTATLLALTVCDERGELLFPDPEAGRRVFGGKAARPCGAVFDAAIRLNALSEADIADLAGN